jgi:hypothetical protein
VPLKKLGVVPSPGAALFVAGLFGRFGSIKKVGRATSHNRFMP